MRLFMLLALLPLASCSCGPTKAGDACDPKADSPCPAGLLCQDSGGESRCLVAVGGACDGKAKDAFCADSSACAGDVCGGRGAKCATDAQCDAEPCADVGAGEKKCEPPVQIKGKVQDALTGDAIAGADVIGLDVEGAAVSKVATSGADGGFVLDLLVARGDDGRPPPGTAITLRADAADYAAFPGGVRQALPISLDDVVEADGKLGLENAATTVALLALPPAERSRPTLSGSVSDGGGGVLIVVTGGATAVTDTDGTFRVFNVAAGDDVVAGYAAGVQLTPQTVHVADVDITGVTLAKASAPTHSVSGSVNIVNGNGNSVTSVVLVVADTFDATLARGDVPRGLRAGNVTGSFSITGVPDGDYVVLAAFENDGLVRDPDTSIGGTGLVHAVVSGNDVTAAASFKVTGALDVRSPGAAGLETVTTAPDFVFADDSSEDAYDIALFDALGNTTFTTQIPGHNGGGDVTVPYAGPALQSGMIYQYRATSSHNGTAISQTEDLKGTFLFSP